MVHPAERNTDQFAVAARNSWGRVLLRWRGKFTLVLHLAAKCVTLTLKRVSTSAAFWGKLSIAGNPTSPSS